MSSRCAGLALLAFLAACSRLAAQDVRPAAALDRALLDYRDELGELRRQCQVRALPPARFFLFGMGDRRKLLYARGELTDARTGELLRRWDVVRDWILPAEYSVVLETRDGQQVAIVEDEEAVWLRRGSVRERIAGSSSGTRLTLPSFSGHPRAAVLKVLHQEILWNIVDGKPLPNVFVYSRPWYRDGAMVAMVLERTGNLPLIKDWILGLREPFDRNNAGEAEADNPGEVLYLISLVSDRSHPLVPGLLEQLHRLEKGGHIEGRSDFAPHPVYQTNWARLGLKSLGLPCHYEVPSSTIPMRGFAGGLNRGSSAPRGNPASAWIIPTSPGPRPISPTASRVRSATWTIRCRGRPGPARRTTRAWAGLMQGSPRAGCASLTPGTPPRCSWPFSTSKVQPWPGPVGGP